VNAMVQEIVLMVGVFALVGWLGWLAAQWARERAREQDRRDSVVEAAIVRFAEARELVDFMGSREGREWLRLGLGARSSRTGLLALVVAGIFGCALGGGLLVNALRLHGAVDPNLASGREDAAWWGVVLLAVGVGSLVAAAVLARLGRAWGLLGPIGDQP
jgi:hypothetical protein